MIALDNGDKIRGTTTTASKVDYLLNGLVGTTVTQLSDGQIASSIGDLYTAASAGIAVTGITCFNTNTTTELVILYLTPSAGTARTFAYVNLPAKAQLYTDGQKIEVMDSSGNIQTSNASILDNTAGGTNGEVTKAPTSDVLFDALALKAPLASPTFTGAANFGSGVLRAVAPDLSGVVTAASALTLPAFTLGGILTTGGYAFNVGSGSLEINTIGAWQGINVNTTTVGAGFRFLWNATPVAGYTVLDFRAIAKDGNAAPADFIYGIFRVVASNVTDGAEAGKFQIYLGAAGAESNLALELTGVGDLWSDLSVDTLTYKVSGTQVVSARGAAVADATDATSVILRLNELLARVRTHGLITT